MDIVEKAEQHFTKAYELVSHEHATSSGLERALLEAQKSLFHDRNARCYFTQGRIQERLYDYASARRSYRYALHLDPELPTARAALHEVCLVIGLSHLQQQKLPEALECFVEASAAAPRNHTVWVYKTVVQDALESINKAIVIAFHDSTEEMYILRAKICFALGFADAGNKDMRSAASLNPHHIEVLHFQSRLYEESEHMYDEALQALRHGDADKAETFLRRALQVSPRDVKLSVFLSKTLRIKGDIDEALQAIEEASLAFQSSNEGAHELGPGSEPQEIAHQRNLILNEVALRYASNQDYHSAIVLLSRVIDSESNLLARSKEMRQSDEPCSHLDYRYHINRGDCYQAMGKLELALADYRCAFELKPRDALVNTRLSLAHYAMGINLFNESEYAAAEVEFSLALRHNSTISVYFESRARCWFSLQDYKRAYEDYKIALRLDPTNAALKARVDQFEPWRTHNNDDSISSSIPRTKRPSKSQTGEHPSSKPSDTVPPLSLPRTAKVESPREQLAKGLGSVLQAQKLLADKDSRVQTLYANKSVPRSHGILSISEFSSKRESMASRLTNIRSVLHPSKCHPPHTGEVKLLMPEAPKQRRRKGDHGVPKNIPIAGLPFSQQRAASTS